MNQMIVLEMDDLRKILKEAEASTKPVIENEAWFTKEAAKFLRTSPSEVDKMAEAGTLPGRKIKNRWRFSSVALYFWLGKEENKVLLNNQGVN